MKSFFIAVVFFLAGFAGLAQKAKRVISLAPSITENIYLLNAQDKLVGCTSYCNLALSDGTETVGSTIDANIEKVFALQPDLVLTMQLTKSQDLEAMKKLGLHVVVLPTPKTFEEICRQTAQIGQLIGAEETADSVLNHAKAIVAEIKTKSMGSETMKKVFFQIGANPIFTVLENTFMDDFMLLTHSENIANGLKRGTMTRESVVAKNPDVIIISTMGGFGLEEKKIWESYTDISAVKNKKVFIIDSETSCSPTPLNFAIALQEVYRFVNE